MQCLMLLLLDLQIRRFLESKKSTPGKGYKETSRCSHTHSNRSRNHAVVEMKIRPSPKEFGDAEEDLEARHELPRVNPRRW